MKKIHSLTRAAAFAAAFLFAGNLVVSAQTAAKKTAAKPAAKPAAKAAAKAAPAKAAAKPAPAKPKTLAEVFSFLPDPVAIVGNKKITKAQFLAQLGNVPVEYIAQLKKEMLQAQASQMIKAMAEVEIMLHQAAKAGIKPSKALMLSEIDKKIKALPQAQRDMLMKQLAVQKKTLDDFKKEMTKDPNAERFYAIQKYVETKIRPKVKVSDAEIQKFYKENPNAFKTPETVDAAHILIPVGKEKDADAKAKAKAASILAQLKKGASFAKLAEKESACNSKKDGGNLGAFTRGQMVPEFEKAAFALTKPGQLSDLVKTQYGYHIIKLNKKTAVSTKKLEEVKDQIRNYLNNTKLQKAIAEDLANAQKTLKVTYPAFKK